MYYILKQFIPGNDQILVFRLTTEDPIFEFENEDEANEKAAELQAADPSGRKYTVKG